MKTFLFSLFLLTTFSLYAQENQSSTEKKKRAPQKGDIYFNPVPVFGVNPAFGFIYGAGTSTSWYMGDPSNTRLSSALAGIAYTTKQQLLFTVKSSVYTAHDNLILLGDWRYLNSSQPTFGTGTGPQSAKLAANGFEYDEGAFSKPLEEAQMLSFKFVRFHETALKKIKDNFYLGIGYHLDYYSNIDDKLLQLDSVPPVITSYYAYNQFNGFAQDKNTLSGVSLNAMYDSRDNQNNPYKGRYAFASFHYNPEFIGSTKNSSTLWLEYRDYLNITKENHHNILAFWSFANLNTSGTLPYMDLPALGWDQYGKSGRGYVQGRFRGTNLLYGEMEFRKHLFGTTKNPDLMGMVAFVNVTSASGNGNNIDLLEYVEPGYGLGMRLMLSKQARTNIALDYAFGNYGSHGFYIRLNETF